MSIIYTSNEKILKGLGVHNAVALRLNSDGSSFIEYGDHTIGAAKDDDGMIRSGGLSLYWDTTDPHNTGWGWYAENGEYSGSVDSDRDLTQLAWAV